MATTQPPVAAPLLPPPLPAPTPRSLQPPSGIAVMLTSYARFGMFRTGEETAAWLQCAGNRLHVDGWGGPRLALLGVHLVHPAQDRFVDLLTYLEWAIRVRLVPTSECVVKATSLPPWVASLLRGRRGWCALPGDVFVFVVVP